MTNSIKIVNVNNNNNNNNNNIVNGPEKKQGPNPPSIETYKEWQKAKLGDKSDVLKKEAELKTLETVEALQTTHKPLKKEGFLKGVWEGLKSDFNIGKMKTTAEKILRPLTTGGAGLGAFALGNAVLSPFIGPLAQPVSLALAALAGYAGHKIGGVINSFSDNNNTKRAEQVLNDLTADKPSGEYNINDFTRLLDKNDVSGKGILSAIVHKLSGGTKRSQADFRGNLNGIDPTNPNHSQVLQALAQRGYKIPEDKLTGLDGHTILLNAAKNASSKTAEEINGKLEKISLDGVNEGETLKNKKTAFMQALSIGNPKEAIRLAKELKDPNLVKGLFYGAGATKGTQDKVLLQLAKKPKGTESVPEDAQQLLGALLSDGDVANLNKHLKAVLGKLDTKNENINNIKTAIKEENKKPFKWIANKLGNVAGFIGESKIAQVVVGMGATALAGTIGTLVGGPLGTVLGTGSVLAVVYALSKIQDAINNKAGLTEKEIKANKKVGKDFNKDVEGVLKNDYTGQDFNKDALNVLQDITDPKKKNKT